MNRFEWNLKIGILFSLLIVSAGIWMIDRDVKSQILALTAQQHSITRYRIGEFKTIQTDLITTLSEHPNIRQYTPDRRSEIESIFYNTLKARSNLMQLRLIDLAGNEVVRCERLRDGKLIIVPLSKLQNKAERDYFRSFSSLRVGEIGFSQFDLNIEHGKIDIPFNPTLRIGMGVYRNGVKIGIIVINYYMEQWIESLQLFTGNRFFMIDREGYFLMHPEKEWEWSRYQSPPKKAVNYFHLPSTFFDKIEDTSFLWIDNNTVAYSLDLYGNRMLALYSSQLSYYELFFEKFLKFASILLVSLGFVVVPLIMLLRQYLNNLAAEKVKTEEGKAYLDTLFDSVFDAIIVIDKNGVIQRVNHQTMRVFGFEQEKIIGMDIVLLIPELHKEVYDRYLCHQSESKTAWIENHLSGRTEKGSSIPISVTFTRMDIADSSYLIIAIRDLTEIKVLEEREREKEKMVIRQSKLAAMGEMLSAIAHQWRQPLNIIGFAVQDLVSAYKCGEIDQNYFKSFEQEIMIQLKYMSKTIDEFRHFFKLEHHAVQCNLRELITQTELLCRAQLRMSGIDFKIHEGESNDPNSFELITYPSEVKQILLNLIINAKEAIEMSNTQPSIDRIITLCLYESEQSIRIDITDHAGGITEEAEMRVFERYFTTKETGAGLGLYICQTLATRHLNGDLGFITDRQAGTTTFSLILPRIVKEVRHRIAAQNWEKNNND